MRSRPIFRHLKVLIPLLLAVTSMGGCDFVTSTSVDPYLTYVVSELDVSGKIPDPLQWVDVIPLSTSDTSYVALIGRASLRADNDQLLLLDEGFNLRVQRNDEFPARLNRSGLVNASGQLLVGNLLYDPANNIVSNTAAPENDIEAGVQVGSFYYTVNFDSPDSFFIEQFDLSFISQGGISVPISLEQTLQGEFRAHDFVDATGNRFVAFIVSGSFDVGPRYVVTVPAAAIETLYGAPQAIFSIADPNFQYGRVILPGWRVWNTIKTRDGIIEFDEDDGTFRRYSATTGAFLDSFSPSRDGDDDENLHAAFFVRGGNYLLLDREREILYEVAPWW